MIAGIVEDLQDSFIICKKDCTLLKIKTKPQELISTLQTAINKGFITLTQIACADWIEDGIFTLNYILTDNNRALNLMVEVDIARDGSRVMSAKDIFPQSLVMERELHEMYGIDFIGNNTLYDFALEDWSGIPPLRREFDTLKFVNEHFEFKKGREDNVDVKAEAKRRRAASKNKPQTDEKVSEQDRKEIDGTK